MKKNELISVFSALLLLAAIIVCILVIKKGPMDPQYIKRINMVDADAFISDMEVNHDTLNTEEAMLSPKTNEGSSKDSSSFPRVYTFNKSVLTYDYIVKPGETLSLIVNNEYQDRNMYQEILSLNEGVLSNPTKLSEGQTIKLLSQRPLINFYQENSANSPDFVDIFSLTLGLNYHFVPRDNPSKHIFMYADPDVAILSEDGYIITKGIGTILFIQTNSDYEYECSTVLPVTHPNYGALNSYFETSTYLSTSPDVESIVSSDENVITVEKEGDDFRLITYAPGLSATLTLNYKNGDTSTTSIDVLDWNYYSNTDFVEEILESILSYQFFYSKIETVEQSAEECVFVPESTDFFTVTADERFQESDMYIGKKYQVLSQVGDNYMISFDSNIASVTDDGYIVPTGVGAGVCWLLDREGYPSKCFSITVTEPGALSGWSDMDINISDQSQWGLRTHIESVSSSNELIATVSLDFDKVLLHPQHCAGKCEIVVTYDDGISSVINFNNLGSFEEYCNSHEARILEILSHKGN